MHSHPMDVQWAPWILCGSEYVPVGPASHEGCSESRRQSRGRRSLVRCPHQTPSRPSKVGGQVPPAHAALPQTRTGRASKWGPYPANPGLRVQSENLEATHKLSSISAFLTQVPQPHRRHQEAKMTFPTGLLGGLNEVTSPQDPAES